MVNKHALGKGLAAIIPDADKIGNGEIDFFQCPIETIEPNPYQPRQQFSASEMEGMVTSVREKGVLTPLLVSKIKDGYQLIAGERRWRAAQKAGLARVPVVVREATPTESLELALIENIHRQDLNPIEEALAYQRLMEEMGATQESLSKKLGKDRSSIANMLRLLKLPRFIQQDVIDGSIHKGHARVLAGFASVEDQKTLRDIVIKEGLSVRQLEGLAKRFKAQPGRETKKDSEADHYLRSLSDDLKRSLGTKVEIKRVKDGGRIVVYFYSDDEFDRLLDRLM